MASVAERPAARAVPVAVALMASAALFFVGTGLHPVWWVTWLAPLPVLLLAPRVSARTTGSVAALAQLLGMTGYAHYALTVLGVPVPLVAGSCVVAAAVFTVVALEFRAVLRRGHTLLAVLGAGATWAAAEYLVAVLTPTGSNWMIANSQADNLPVLQVVSFTGPWGVSFVLFTTTAALAALTAPSSTGTARRRAGAVGALVLAMTLGNGLVRLAPAPAETVRVSVVVVPTAHDQPVVGSAAGDALLAADLNWVHTEATPGQVVVFPEKDIHVEDATLPGVVARFAAVARERDVVLVLGVEHRSGAHLYNTALTFPRDGSAPLVYHKRYPVPGVEDAVTPGGAPGFLPGDGRGGVAICADMGQVSLGREYGRRRRPDGRARPRLRRGRVGAEPRAAAARSGERVLRGAGRPAGVPHPERWQRTGARPGGEHGGHPGRFGHSRPPVGGRRHALLPGRRLVRLALPGP
jgi:apolipoprotein N-acyltransferase